MKILVSYSGWVEVEKEDLEVQKIDNGKFVDVDTSNVSVEEIVQLLYSGKLFLKSLNDIIENNEGDVDEILFDIVDD